MVVPEQVSDADMVLLARDIAKQIEFELEYPGQIKVNVIRESRVTDFLYFFHITFSSSFLICYFLSINADLQIFRLHLHVSCHMSQVYHTLEQKTRIVFFTTIFRLYFVFYSLYTWNIKL